MAVLAFDLVYFFGLTADDLLGCVISLLACLLLLKLWLRTRPNRRFLASDRHSKADAQRHSTIFQ